MYKENVHTLTNINKTSVSVDKVDDIISLESIFLSQMVPLLLA